MKAHLGGEPANRTAKNADWIFALFFFSLIGIVLCKDHNSDLSNIRTWVFLISALGLIMSGVLTYRFNKKVSSFAYSDAHSVPGQPPAANVAEESSAPRAHS